MKIRIFNDYIIDIKKYYKKIKRNIRKIYRKIKYHWNNPKTKFGIKIISFVNFVVINVINLIKIIHKKIKTIINNLSLKEKFTILGIFIFGILLVSIILPSYSIYQDEYQFSMMGSKVGTNEYDYTLLIYVEGVNYNGEGNNRYILSNEIPTSGYEYSRYECKNNSTLTFNEETNNTQVVLEEKDICSVYFNFVSTGDITILTMLEDSVDSNTYTNKDLLPYYGYRYNNYECENNSLIIYDSELHKATFEGSTNDVCKLYFNKENDDTNIILYVEEDGIYTAKNVIPSGISYILIDSKSECFNNKDERIETEISYVDGYIELSSTEAEYCKVYMDLANE